MSWTHSSRSVALGVLLAIGLAVGMAGIAAAASFSGPDPEPTLEGEEVSIEVVSEDPFSEFTEWELEGTSELDDPSWTITLVDNTGDEETVGQAGSTFSQPLDGDENIVEVRVRVTGNAPEINDFDYEDVSIEESTAIQLNRAEGGEPLGTWSVQRVTGDSQDARAAIDDAQAAIDDSSSSSAEERLQEAITFYNSGEFDSAIEAANDARDTAESEGETERMLLIIGGIVVALAIIGGGFYIYKQRQTNTNKLQ